MDTSEKTDKFEDLNRLKAMKEKGFRRDTPQTKPVEKSVPKKPTFYCISCNVSFDTKDTLKEHNQVCKSKKTPDFEPVKPPERVSKIPVIQSDVNVKAVHPGFVPRQYNCHDCGFQSSGAGRSKMLLRHARETGHRTDDLSEKCFTCGTVSKNFVITTKIVNSRKNVGIIMILAQILVRLIIMVHRRFFSRTRSHSLQIRLSF